MFYRVGNALFPDLVPQSKKGFLIDGNCFLVDGFIEELVFLVTYCANDFMPNFPVTKRLELSNSSAVWRWFEGMADRGARDFSSPRLVLPPPQPLDASGKRIPSEPEREWTGSYDWFVYQGLNWVRPKVADLQWKNRREEQMTVWRMLSKQQWERAISTAPFDTLSWFIRLIDHVFGINTELEIDNIIGHIEDFVNNDNLDYMAAPVGLKYWLLFWVRCQFKPLPGQLSSNAALNLSCAAGMGLEAALGYVVWISILVFVVGSVILPATLLPLIGVSAFLFYIVLIPAMAWHYSPRCWLMSPALSIAGINGISVPLLPFPVAFPALPFCLLTEVRHLLNKYITTCYRVLWDTNLEFLFAPYMILTNACPTCPQKVAMANCARDVGFDGVLTTLAFFIVQVWPGATEFVKTIASLAPCQSGTLLNGFCGDAVRVFAQVSNLTGDDFKQHVWCSWFTLIILLAVGGGVGFLAFSFIAMLARVLVRIGSAFWSLFTATGILHFLPFGSGGANLYDEFNGPLPEYAPEDAFEDVEMADSPDSASASATSDTVPSAPPPQNEPVARRIPVPNLVPVSVSNTGRRNQGVIASVSEGIIEHVGHYFKAIKRE